MGTICVISTCGGMEMGFLKKSLQVLVASYTSATSRFALARFALARFALARFTLARFALSGPIKHIRLGLFRAEHRLTKMSKAQRELVGLREVLLETSL